MKNLKRFLCVVLGLMLCLVAVSFGACDNEPKASDAVDADVYAPGDHRTYHPYVV